MSFEGRDKRRFGSVTIVLWEWNVDRYFIPSVIIPSSANVARVHISGLSVRQVNHSTEHR